MSLQKRYVWNTRKQQKFMNLPKKFLSFYNSSKMSPIEKLWSVGTFSLGTVALFIVILIADQPRQTLQKFISPLVDSIVRMSHTFDPKKTQKHFSFAPGWAQTKFDNIDFTDLHTLAYFDIPLNADGTFDRENDGYATLRSEYGEYLFETAHEHGTKVVLTISQTHNPSIEQFLNSERAQRQTIEEAITEMEETGADGIALDFEYTGSRSDIYKEKYSTFVSDFTAAVRNEKHDAQIDVVVSTEKMHQSLYDVSKLSQHADYMFVMAYSFAVPEIKNAEPTAPVSGHEEEAYWDTVTTVVSAAVKDIPEEKLVMERAWYGNGDNYPFYQSLVRENGQKNVVASANTLSTPLDQTTINRLVSEVPAKARPSARKYIPVIAKALEDEGILTRNVLSYALATIEHETAGTFEPLEEFKGRKSARRLGYEGGTNYFGRGFIQLTHSRNYKMMGQRIGLGNNLVAHPELGATPEVAAKVLAAFFKDNGVAALARSGSFVAARKPINPDYQGYWIASLAWKYWEMIS
jgi:predicted chitinase